MNISKNDKVNKLLIDIQSISAEQFEMVVSVRDMFFNANEDLEEAVKYGGLAFSTAEGLIGGIYTYKAHISVEFSDGANFTDADAILDGSGKKRRHLKLSSPEDITQKHSDYFIKQAVSATN